MTATILKHTARRTCKACGLTKPIEEFARHYSKGGGYLHTCEPCFKPKARKAAKKFREDNPRYHRPGRLKSMYGLTEADYHRMLKAQNGGCGVCKRPPKTDEVFCIDHDHLASPGRIVKSKDHIRGLLCKPCNSAIGFLKESPTMLRVAAEYLERHYETQSSNRN